MSGTALPSTIIYLNGTSSSGKTSLALALQDILDIPYLHFSIDIFETVASRRQIRRGIYPNITTLEWGFTRCIAALATAGNNVLVDDVLSEPWELPPGQQITTYDLLYQRVLLLSKFRIWFIKVFCPLDELERREKARGDRIVGLARFQFERVHQQSQYDIEVDTSQKSPEACASDIVQAMMSKRKPQSFIKMRDIFDITTIE
jgi:chloramphenicol 3-O phosphotransferase